MGPDYKRPAIITPNEWRQTATPGESIANLNWWEIYHDPVLTNLITTALDNNKDLSIAAARVEQSLGNYRIQRANLVPWVDYSADWSRGRSGISGQTAGQFNVFGLLSYEVDFWGRIRALWMNSF